MHRPHSAFIDFSWHKQHHHLAYAIARAEQDHLRFHECMEMLDMIAAHAEEEFALYSLLSVTGAFLQLGETFTGGFIVTKSRIPSADEFDEGALLVLTGHAKDTPLTGTLTLFIHEETNINFEH